jgi:hypothetical protein
MDAEADGHPLPRITYFPDLWRDIPWPRPEIQVQVVSQEPVESEWVTCVDVSATAYTRFCHLILPDTLRPFWIDDNFYDLSARHRKRVMIRSARPFTAVEVAVGHWYTEWA